MSLRDREPKAKGSGELKQRGYSVVRTRDNEWRATSAECELIAESPVELLALAAMFESRGPDWQASDHEIEDYLERYESAPRSRTVQRSRRKR
jgi:hypothetical protein